VAGPAAPELADRLLALMSNASYALTDDQRLTALVNMVRSSRAYILTLMPDNAFEQLMAAYDRATGAFKLPDLGTLPLTKEVTRKLALLMEVLNSRLPR
jgi:hypothetical protein